MSARGRKAKKLEDYAPVDRHVVEETVLLHAPTFDGNSCEARIVITVDTSDGRSFGINRVTRLRFRETKP